MSDLIFNVAKGRSTYYASLPGTNDALVLVPLESAGLEADAAMRDHDTLAAILAASSNEQTTMGRKVLASVTVAIDDTGDQVVVDAADATWTAATGNPVGALVLCYNPDTTTGTDADLVPIAKYDFTTTPAGSDIVAQISTSGLYTAS